MAEDITYDSCIFKGIKSSGISGFVPREKHLVKVTELNNCISSHCKKLRITVPHDFSEADLIFNRSGIRRENCNENDVICPKHRYSLGIYYQPSRLCLFPEHKSIVKTREENSSNQISQL